MGLEHLRYVAISQSDILLILFLSLPLLRTSSYLARIRLPMVYVNILPFIHIHDSSDVKYKGGRGEAGEERHTCHVSSLCASHIALLMSILQTVGAQKEVVATAEDKMTQEVRSSLP
jgi:hypothetical protein